ncbi:MAG: helix-turn-helix domain-containing protein [Rhodobacteraceae bacterium]|nr:helix-turn-helix domain-containing protein [Paracoccaceae bacterium]
MKHDPGFDTKISRAVGLPDWVPTDARAYLEHTRHGRSMREVARAQGGHASTVLRHVRRLETRRDDPLVDEALLALEQGAAITKSEPQADKGDKHMQHSTAFTRIAADAEVEKEGRRILRRLCETSAFLIVASGMEKAAVMRETVPGKPVRIAVVDRHIAQSFALKDWVECYRKGKIASYRITSAGKAALKRLLAEGATHSAESQGFAEAPDLFREQHKVWQTREIRENPDAKPRRLRYNLAESPLTALGRRKDTDGKPFLSAGLVQAGERLREDFEMAQMGPRITQNWDRFLTGGRSGGLQQDGGIGEGPRAARERVAAALKDLGPGLGDIAMRCCCFLEGMETAEKRMGWSARSGKIVLRIALQRLKLHYEETHGGMSPMIG